MRYPPSPPVADQARAVLAHNAYLVLRTIECDFRDGVLTLRGCVPSYYLKQRAQAAIAHLGAERVVNEIEVLSIRPPAGAQP